MRKTIITMAAAALLSLSAAAQEAKTETRKQFIPVGGTIDVEALGTHINLDMDISRLSLSDLRILRNAFAARQGHCFADYALRAVFSQTSWYEDKMLERLETESPKPISYSREERAFMERIKAREAELRRRNFAPEGGGRVNTDNIINKFQLEGNAPALYNRLRRDGFAIVPRRYIQLFHCYENNDYHNFPNFITTDIHLQLVHTLFANILQEAEKTCLAPLLGQFFLRLNQRAEGLLSEADDDNTRQAAAFAVDYSAIGCRLLGLDGAIIPEGHEAIVAEEMARIDAANDSFSPFLGATDTPFMYSLFRPRGYYTRSEAQSRYFKAMMWAQNAAHCTNQEAQLRRAVLLATAIEGDDSLRRTIERIDLPIKMLVGQPDNVAITQIAEAMRGLGLSPREAMTSRRKLRRLAERLEQMSRRQMRIRPKVQISCPEKLTLLPQRYIYDAEVMQELVDTHTRPTTLRGCPTGLDVLAALGAAPARRLLLGELGEGERWPEYASRLDSVGRLMPSLTNDSTATNLWLKALTALCDSSDSRRPYFMRTPQWDKKSLNTALASWAEMKHDIILYAKQPMAAECGSGVPEPIVAGYVEPNTPYWRAALTLLRQTKAALQRAQMWTGRLKSLTEQVEEQTDFLLHVSEKELNGQRLSEAELRSIELLGSTYEWLTLDIMSDEARNAGTAWDDVQGTDRSIATIADVYTANANNNPDKGILHEGVAHADDIYVVVEINGTLHLTRGAVFSYREMKTPLGTRLTDEEWQQMIERLPRLGAPEWMNEIVLPDSVPADNEQMLYSSGC